MREDIYSTVYSIYLLFSLSRSSGSHVDDSEYHHLEHFTHVLKMSSANPAAALLERYDQERLVARGTFGDVYSYRLRLEHRAATGSPPGKLERIAVKKVRLRYVLFGK